MTAQVPQRPVYQKGAKPVKVKALRNAARGAPCQLRLDGCQHNGAVLCHLRMFGWGGTGLKPFDFLAVFACSRCHDALDRRVNDAEWGYDDVLRALGNTLIIQFQNGNLMMKGE